MDNLEGLVATVGHIAWPATAVGIAVMARKELRAIFVALARRIEDRGSAVSITKEGLEIKAVVEAQEARLVSMQAEQDQVKSLAMRQFEPVRRFTEGVVQVEVRNVDDRLREMADAYMNINLPDHSARTRAKNVAAEEMAFYVASNKISRDQLAKEEHEGLLVALAESIILSADASDAERLLKAARGAKRLHVRYRVLIAVTKLVERNLLPSGSIGSVRELLRDYEIGADAPLKRLLSSVTSLLNEAVHISKS